MNPAELDAWNQANQRARDDYHQAPNRACHATGCYGLTAGGRDFCYGCLRFAWRDGDIPK